MGRRELGRWPDRGAFTQDSQQGEALSRHSHVSVAPSTPGRGVGRHVTTGGTRVPGAISPPCPRPRGWMNCNLRTTFEKIIRRAGLTPWARLRHNLRASCESDLAAHFPLAVVTKWLSSTPSIDLRRYVEPTEAAFQEATKWIPPQLQAAQNPAQQGAEMGGNIPKPPFTDLPQHAFLPSVATGCNLVQIPQIAEAGFEPARG